MIFNNAWFFAVAVDLRLKFLLNHYFDDKNLNLNLY